MREEDVLLQDVAHFALEVFVERLSVEEYSSGVGPKSPRKHVQKGGLARACGGTNDHVGASRGFERKERGAFLHERV